MRITGGELRGRRIKTPPGSRVRPTQDAVREALFSMLATRVANAAFADLFAGSGAVGLEAWSRGARSVCWVEEQPAVARMLADNVRTLCGEQGRIVRDDVFRWLKRPPEGPPFDIVYADPPYGDDTTDDGIEEVMTRLAASGAMAADGLFIAEQRTGRPMPAARGWSRLKDRRYGHTRLTLFACLPPPPA